MSVNAPAGTPAAIPEVPHYWARHTEQLRARLAREVPHEELKRLHRKTPWRHFLVAARQFLLLAASTWAAARFPVLLHEVIHNAVWTGRRDRAGLWLGRFYDFPSGIAATQFTRWHLTHHAELGSDLADPKRHHLTPKINARWLKLLYFTPALFVIYFRAARRETATYPAEQQRTIRIERNLTIAGHLAILAAIR